MTRQEQLKFCKTCLKRRFNVRKGIVCSLTDEIADFDVTCKNYEKDENVVIPEPEINTKKKRTEKRIKRKREKIPETITKDDLFLILGFSLSNILIIRLINYFSLGYNTTRNYILFLIITFISISIALLLRDRKANRYRFFGDLKFKLLYTLIYTVVHVMFILSLKTVGYIVPGYFIFSNLFSVFIVSMLSYLIVKPIHLIRSRKLNSDEKVS